MLTLAFPAQHDDDVILKAHLRCRGCLCETFPLVPVSRQPAGRSERSYFMARHIWQQMPFHCECGHTAANLLTVDYATEGDMRPALPEPVAAPEPEPAATEIRYTFVRDLAFKPELFPQLGLPRLMRCA